MGSLLVQKKCVDPTVPDKVFCLTRDTIGCFTSTFNEAITLAVVRALSHVLKPTTAYKALKIKKTQLKFVFYHDNIWYPEPCEHFT